MEENQSTFKNGNDGELEISPVYGCIKADDFLELVEKLNKRALNGYRPVWDTLVENVGTYQIFVYNPDLYPETIETDPMELEIIEALNLAEQYRDESVIRLRDLKNTLLIDTDYDIVNAKRHKEDPPLPPLTTNPDKKAWVELQVSENEKEEKEAKRWLKYVEAMARKQELPARDPPWIVKEKKAMEAEEHEEMPTAESAKHHLKRTKIH